MLNSSRKKHRGGWTKPVAPAFFYPAPAHYFCPMRCLIFFACLFLAPLLRAQQPDSIPVVAPRDSAAAKKAAKIRPQAAPQAVIPLPDSAAAAVIAADSTGKAVNRQGFVGRFFSKNYPDPKKAALFSFILPGSGQIYNKKWWKVPIVYAGLGGLTWLEINNIRTYREARDNYRWLVDDDPATVVAPEFTGADATSLRDYRDVWRRYVEQSSLALGLAYLLTATDAYVDAHLSNFDVSEDLSLRIGPRTSPAPGQGMALGLGVTLEFGGTRAEKMPHRFAFAQP